MDSSRGANVMQTLLPLVTIIGYVVVGASGQGRNLLLLVPMGLSVIASSFMSIWNLRRQRRIDDQKRASYTQRLIEMRKDMVASHDMQRTFYMYNYPEPDVLFQYGEVNDSRSGSRLWERRTWDDDFGLVRLGIGTRPSTVIYEVAEADNEEDPLMNDALKLAQDSQFVADAPITIPLWQQNVDSEEEDNQAQIRHVLGIAGDSTQVYPLVRGVLTHFLAFHVPTDTSLYVVGVNKSRKEWAWAGDLPHCPAPPPMRGQRTGEPPEQWFPLCFETENGRHEDIEQDRISRFWKQIRNELDTRSMRLQDEKSPSSVRLPFMLVVVDMLEAVPDGDDSNWPANSSLQNVESSGAVSSIVENGRQLGAAIIFLVPERRKVPSSATAVIEVAAVDSRQRVDFRYAEVGVNTPRYVGRADMVSDFNALHDFATKLASLDIPRSYGEGIAESVTLLELNKARFLHELNVLENWRSSVHNTEEADWLEVPVGLMPGNEVRRLHFSADRDGVHGLIAGSTGSGKSELLMTLILGLAMRYDPSVVNFVLIDYKGGQAFEPFRSLPHKVDIVTDLQGADVARVFAAIRAELQRREHINTQTRAKHIVHYRQKGFHLLSPDEFEAMHNQEKEPYPHLFIIIDEFAEMIAESPEYKAELNSITRLGRALGVTLILAAQRPTGVTDQMRANIKFRICLRVETREESNELLRRSDAAYLPPGIPGRGYLQIGNENIELVQVAYTGAAYDDDSAGQTRRDIIDWSQFTDEKFVWVEQLESPRGEPPKFFEVLVRELEKLAREHSTPQKKPWPNRLPQRLPLDSLLEETEYLDEGDRDFLRWNLPLGDDQLRLNPFVEQWMSGERVRWDALDWRERAMRPVIGLIDYPGRAKQLVLRLNLARGHAVLFGTAGSGKTTFLRSTVVSLAATHSPEDLHIYILDFGGRALDVFSELPHVGAVIPAVEEERVERLLRKLDSIVEERTTLLSRADSFASYNADPRNPRLPAVLVVIDNFAEFRESFEDLLPALLTLIRSGLAVGLHFVITAEQTSTVPGKLYSLFSERLTLRLADASDYTNVVGRGVSAVDESAGRGYVAIDRVPLQFQVALPVGGRAVAEVEDGQNLDEVQLLQTWIARVDEAWDNEWQEERLRPFPIDLLENKATALGQVLDELEYQTYLREERPPYSAIMGIDDNNLLPALINLRQQPHFIVAGEQLSGKTTALRTWILSLAHAYSPDEIGMVLVDSQGTLFDYPGGATSLSALPHVLAVVSEVVDEENPKSMTLAETIRHLRYEYEVLPARQAPKREVFIFIDNYDDFQDLKPGNISELTNLTRSRQGRPAVHFIVCGTPLSMPRSNELVKRVAATRFGMAMDLHTVTQSIFNGRVPRKLGEREFPVGRAFVMQSGKMTMIQLATPFDARAGEMPEDGLDRWVGAVAEAHGKKRAEWLPMADSDPETSGESLLEASPEPDDEDPLEGYTPDEIEVFRHRLIARNLDVGANTELIRDMEPEDVLGMAQGNKFTEAPGHRAPAERMADAPADEIAALRERLEALFSDGEHSTDALAQFDDAIIVFIAQDTRLVMATPASDGGGNGQPEPLDYSEEEIEALRQRLVEFLTEQHPNIKVEPLMAMSPQQVVVQARRHKLIDSNGSATSTEERDS
jgi:DNA segregation ATPase FtsK/SpoIIIE-like protein